MDGYTPAFPMNLELDIESGKNGQLAIPSGLEFWFDVTVFAHTAPGAGSLTIGSAINVQPDIVYPMANRGFITIPGTDMPQKAVGSGGNLPPYRGCASFIGQVSCGMLGFSNSTDSLLSIMVRLMPRRIAESDK
jgi:hypothetical protein